MAIETFLTLQHYLTIILLIVAGVFWARLQEHPGLSMLKSQKLYTILLLLTLPFLVRAMTFIPERISLLLQNLLFALIFIILCIASIKLYRMHLTQRKKVLRELLDKAATHPIRLEFARHIIRPELQKLTEKEDEFRKKERSVLLKEADFAKREQLIEQKITELADTRKALAEEEKQSRTSVEDMRKKRREAERRLHTLEAKEKEMTERFEELASERVNLAKMREELKRTNITLRKEYERRLQVLEERMKREVETIRQKAFADAERKEQAVEKREADLEAMEREVHLMKTQVREREKNLK